MSEGTRDFLHKAMIVVAALVVLGAAGLYALAAVTPGLEQSPEVLLVLGIALPALADVILGRDSSRKVERKVDEGRREQEVRHRELIAETRGANASQRRWRLDQEDDTPREGMNR